MMKSLPFIVLEDGTFNEEGLRSLGLPIEFITKSMDEHNVVLDYGAWGVMNNEPSCEQTAWAIDHYKLEPVKRQGCMAWYRSYAYYECTDYGHGSMKWQDLYETARFNVELVEAFINMANDPCLEGDERNIHLYVEGWRIVVQLGRTEKADRDYDEGIANGTIWIGNED